MAHKALAALLAVVIVGGGVTAAVFVPRALANNQPTEPTTIEITTEETTEATIPVTTIEEETTDAPTEPLATTTQHSTAATTLTPTTTKKPSSSVELSKYINANNGFFTVEGAELAKLLGYNNHAYRKSFEQDTWHTYSNSAGSEIGCGGNADGRNADVIGAITIKDASATLYGLRVGDPMPQSNALASFGYTESSTYKGSFWLGDRVITLRTSDGNTISQIRYVPQEM